MAPWAAGERRSGSASHHNKAWVSSNRSGGLLQQQRQGRPAAGARQWGLASCCTSGWWAAWTNRALGLGWHERVTCMNTSRLVAKQVGVSGQISLGKEYAGRTVLIDSTEPGVWVIKTAQTIPDSELWLHQPEASARLERAFLAMTEPPRAADLNALEQHLSGK